MSAVRWGCGYDANGDAKDTLLLPPLAAEFGEGSFRQVNVGAPCRCSIPDKHCHALSASRSQFKARVERVHTRGAERSAPVIRRSVCKRLVAIVVIVIGGYWHRLGRC